MIFNAQSTMIRPSCNRKKHSELRSCVTVEAAVLGSPSLTVLVVFAGVKLHLKKKDKKEKKRRYHGHLEAWPSGKPLGW